MSILSRIFGGKDNTKEKATKASDLITRAIIRVHNNIVKVNHLEISSNYHVFKKGIRPEWEDEANAHGGKFSIQLPRTRTGETINDYWLNLVNFLFDKIDIYDALWLAFLLSRVLKMVRLIY
jgi:hypothetical protein